MFTEKDIQQIYDCGLTVQKVQSQIELIKSGMSYSNLVEAAIIGNGILKIAPFFYWTSEELNGYLKEFNLESEEKYYDPTKALANRECGLHT